MEFISNHSCIKITDPEKELAFYEKTIGFTLQSVVHHTPQVTSYFVGKETGCLLQLLVMPGGTNEHHGYGHFSVETDDIHAAYAHHLALGCVTGGIVEQPHQFGYFIRDPELYETEIVQLK